MRFAYKRMSVLLVDQASMNLDAMEKHLDPMEFYRIWTAKTQEEVLQALEEKAIDMMVVAWKMNPVSGLQIVEKVRRLPAYAMKPIILIAEKLDPVLEEKGKAAGADMLLGQPLKADAFRLAVDQVLEPLVDPKDEEFLKQMHAASLARKKGDLPAAEKAYRAALEVRFDESAQLGLGRVLKQLGDLDGAEKSFVAALKANPLSLKAFMGLSSVYQTLGRLDDALKVLAAAVNAAKKLKEGGAVESSLYFYMGELELELQHLNKALGYFDQATQASPDNSDLQVKIGDSLVKHEHLDQAEAFYKRALELDPELAHVYNRLAMAYRRQKKPEMAINLYKKAMAFHPEDEHLLYNLALCFWDLDDYREVAGLLATAMKINPGFSEAQKLLDAALYRQGRQADEPVEEPAES